MNPSNFSDIPPSLCKKKGGATFRIGCDDNGYPLPKSTVESIVKKDLSRAQNPIPGHDFRGKTFFETSTILNEVLKANGVKTRECSEWSAEELQTLQRSLYHLRNENFNEIYAKKSDPREIKGNINWKDHNELAEKTDLQHVQRDGHCHEAVMWFIHHLTEEMKKTLIEQTVYIPLLAYGRHVCPDNATSDEQKVYQNYKEQVTCADCHSDYTPP